MGSMQPAREHVDLSDISLASTKMNQTPCTDQNNSRKRGRAAEASPLGRLLEQIRRLKLPCVDAATANQLLGPFIREALKYDDGKGTLLAIVQQFGWETGTFSQDLDLGSFSLLLQKYRYERLQELGSGSYAVVYKARNRETDEVIALKKLRFGFDEQGLPSSTLREISLLKELKHSNIVELKDIIYGFGTNNVYVVLECLDCDLRDLLDADQQLDMWQIKSFLFQILKAVHHAHMHCVMHRDLKPQNILVDASHTQVKVADFGLARSFLPPFKAYTDKVVTLWYRAPELLLGVSSYSAAIDMWSVGCIFAEMVNREPLFRAESEIGLLHKIFEALGTPNDTVWSGVERLAHYRHNFPHWQARGWSAIAPRLAGDAQGLDLLAALLSYDPEARITAAQALKHPWFDDLKRGSASMSRASSGAGASVVLDHMQGAAAIGSAAVVEARGVFGPVRQLQHLQQRLQPQHQMPLQYAQPLQPQMPHLPGHLLFAGQQPQQSAPCGRPAAGLLLAAPGAARGAAGGWANIPLSSLPSMAATCPAQQPQVHQVMPV